MRERNNLREKVKQLESAAQKRDAEMQDLSTQLAEVRNVHDTEAHNLNAQLESARKDAETLRAHLDELARDKSASDAVIAELRAQIAQLQQLHAQQTHPHRIATPSPSSYRPIGNSSNLPASFVGSHPFIPSSPFSSGGYVPSPSLRSSSPLHPSSLHGASPLTNSHFTYTPSPTSSTHTATPPTPIPTHAATPPTPAHSSPFNARPAPSHASPAPPTSPIPPSSAGPTPFTSPSHNVLRNSAFTSILSNSTSDLLTPKSTTELQVFPLSFSHFPPFSLPPICTSLLFLHFSPSYFFAHKFTSFRSIFFLSFLSLFPLPSFLSR